jgi:non-specific serine/threonine protein kinase
LLRRHRLAAGLSQEALAERAGLSARGLSDLERGRRRWPQAATVRLLVRALGLAPARAAALAAAAARPRRADRGVPPPTPTNLPRPVTSFVGRERELAAAGALLRGSPLLTLTGPGGVGKTRLALEVARAAARAAGAYPDGVWRVELAPLADPALVPVAVAGAVGVRERPGEPLPETLARALRAKRLLLVLDNCEHLLDACARLSHAVMQSCPGVRVLATSREPLRVAGEVVWRAPPLAAPPPDGDAVPEQVSEYAAARLFAERARAADAGFVLMPEHAPAVAEVCRRLDGLPLALELAAARVRVLPVEQIAARLGERFRLLTGGDRTALPRQQSLRASLEWSHALLSRAEQVLFRRLAAFAGGWTLAAAEAVGAGEGVAPDDVLELLAGLVDKSLVVAEGRGGEERYGLLETVREYALGRLQASGEGAALRARHAGYYLALAEAAEPELEGPRQLAWLDRLEAEHANLRQALRWWEARGAAAQGVRMNAALRWFWHWRGHTGEGRERLAVWLAWPAQDVPDAVRAEALWAAGRLAYNQGDDAAARAHLEEAAALARRAGDDRQLARALTNLVPVALREGDPAARALSEEGVAAARAAGDPRILASSLFARGEALERTDPLAARVTLEESLALVRGLGNPFMCSAVLLALAGVARAEGARAEARRCCAEALGIRRALGDKRGVALVLHDLGALAAEEADAPQAAAHFREGLALFRDVGDRHGVAWCLTGLAGVAAAGAPARAARLFGAATPWLPCAATVVHPADPAARERAVDAVRARLGGAAFAAAWDAGRAMPLEEAVAYALERDERAPPPASAPGTSRARRRSAPARPASPLTRREHEVAALVAGGLTNRQIAAALVISERTAVNHVEHILTKLGFSSRVQVGVWAAEHGLAAR